MGINRYNKVDCGKHFSQIYLSIWTELVKNFYTSRLVGLRSRKIVLQSCSCIKVNFGPRGGSLTFSTAWGPQFRHKGMKFAPPLNMIFKALNGCQNKACILSCFHLSHPFIDPSTMTIHHKINSTFTFQIMGEKLLIVRFLKMI